MFTTGSKLFIGATTLSLITTVVFAMMVGGSEGWLGTVALISLTVALAFVTGIVIFIRDANVRSAAPDALTASSAAQPAAGASMWPAFGALAATLIVIGVCTKPIVFLVGAAFLLSTIGAWMVQGWSERASGDAAYNESVRKRTLQPLAFPLAALLLIGIIVYSFSRIMLFLSKAGGPAAFIVVAALITFAGFVFAARPGLKKGVIAGVATIAMLGLVSTGAAMAISGQRHIEEHPTVSNDPSICTSNDETEADDNASQNLAAKTNTSATIFLKDGKLYAEVIGIAGPQQSITLQRGNPSNIVFKNFDAEPARLTANLGEFEKDVNGTKVTEKPVTCTTLVEKGGRSFLSLRMTKSSIASKAPYTFTVPGVEGSSVEIVVP
jgi:hypothetical protein